MNLNPFSGEFDCGCRDREQVMGAGDWQTDAGVIVGGIVIALIITLVLKSR